MVRTSTFSTPTARSASADGLRGLMDRFGREGGRGDARDLRKLDERLLEAFEVGLEMGESVVDGRAGGHSRSPLFAFRVMQRLRRRDAIRSHEGAALSLACRQAANTIRQAPKRGTFHEHRNHRHPRARDPRFPRQPYGRGRRHSWRTEAADARRFLLGASTGTREAVERRDGDKKRYLGKGCPEGRGCRERRDLGNAPAARTRCSRRVVDQMMIEADGTKNEVPAGRERDPRRVAGDREGRGHERGASPLPLSSADPRPALCPCPS
jgi:hypothetical protein